MSTTQAGTWRPVPNTSVHICNPNEGVEIPTTQADREANQRMFAPVQPMPDMFRRSEPTSWIDAPPHRGGGGGITTQPKPRTLMSYTQLHELAKSAVFDWLGCFPDSLRSAYNGLTEDEAEAFVLKATVRLASTLSKVGL